VLRAASPEAAQALVHATGIAWKVGMLTHLEETGFWQVSRCLEVCACLVTCKRVYLLDGGVQLGCSPVC